MSTINSDNYRQSIIIDLGMCLRVPYDNDGDSITDVSAGTLRRLIRPLIPCGKPNYISPEVLLSEGPFDGFAIDVWSAGVILFIMLVGLPPWEFARIEDPRYKLVSRGGLERMLRNWNRDVSPMATDLLQSMLMEDPRRRLSLVEVLDHPWVTEEEPMPGMKSSDNGSVGATEGWRNG